jgi:kelch-like protein 12
MMLETADPIALPKLNVARAGHTLSVVDVSDSNRILWFAYAIGGFDGRRKSSSVERYILGERAWEVMADMKYARSGHGSVVVEKTIYVLGGKSSYVVLNCCEFMHAQSDTWTTISPMKHARANFGSTYLDPYIIVVGGWDGSRWLDTVEAYDPRIDAWRDLAALPFPKSSMGCLILRKCPSEFENDS